MTQKYNITWSGMDRGHDGQWAGPIWLSTFDILAKHDGESYKDPESPLYKDLTEQIPSVTWKSSDSSSPNGWRLYFRDAQEPWSSTGVVNFDDTNGFISITNLGKKLASREISAADVFIGAMENHVEFDEYPFAILAAAFLDSAASQGLTLEELTVGVMQNFRPGTDTLESAIKASANGTIEATPLRRFRHMLSMLESIGAIQSKGGKWIRWNQNLLLRFKKKLATEISKPMHLDGSIESFWNDIASHETQIRTNKSMLLRAMSSLLSKRFLIATGLAGSGKTKLAQAFSRWITNSEHCYKIIPVGADWTGNENILGYPNGLDPESYISKPTLDLILHAEKHDKIPHFLILDEMNLSHVERYFADILSAIESESAIPLHQDAKRKTNDLEVPAEITLPKNLFIIGTVNVDETTYMFSPKVLDRANVIEFRMEDVELGAFLENPVKPNLDHLNGKGIDFAEAFVAAANSPVEVPVAVKEPFNTELRLLFNALHCHGAEFGYRTAYESARFVHFYHLLGNYNAEDVEWLDGAMDCVIFQKLLPKLHGSRVKLGPLLKKLWFLCIKPPSERKVDPLEAAEASTEEPVKDVPANAPYPLSAEKIYRMWRLMMDNGFASFAEA